MTTTLLIFVTCDYNASDTCYMWLQRIWYLLHVTTTLLILATCDYNASDTCYMWQQRFWYLQFFSLPIHMPSVLFLFRINPENDPNISISFMAKAISVLELTNNVVSSAYWDILMMCALSSIFTYIPLIFLFSLSLNAIISTEITNKRADKGYPWRISSNVFKNFRYPSIILYIII